MAAAVDKNPALRVGDAVAIHDGAVCDSSQGHAFASDIDTIRSDEGAACTLVDLVARDLAAGSGTQKYSELRHARCGPDPGNRVVIGVCDHAGSDRIDSMPRHIVNAIAFKRNTERSGLASVGIDQNSKAVADDTATARRIA